VTPWHWPSASCRRRRCRARQPLLLLSPCRESSSPCLPAVSCIVSCTVRRVVRRRRRCRHVVHGCVVRRRRRRDAVALAIRVTSLSCCVAMSCIVRRRHAVCCRRCALCVVRCALCIDTQTPGCWRHSSWHSQDRWPWGPDRRVEWVHGCPKR